MLATRRMSKPRQGDFGEFSGRPYSGKWRSRRRSERHWARSHFVRLEPGIFRQCWRGISDEPRYFACDDRGRWRQYHTHSFATRFRRRAAARGLLRDQRRTHSTWQGDGDRSRGAEHPRQYAFTGCSRNRAVDKAVWRYGYRTSRVRSETSVAKAGATGGNSSRSCVSRERCIKFHDRRRPFGRRWL